MNTRTALVATALMVAAGAIYTVALYPSLPDKIPIHWDIHGDIDGWGAKGWAVFLLPGASLIFAMLMVAGPWLSPRQYSPETFLETWNFLMVMCISLFWFLQGICLQAALNPDMNMGRALVAGMFVFFAILGNMLGKVRRNFWMGVRTPWTLASDTVWVSTHRIAARLMVAAGVLGAVAAVIGVPLSILFVGLMLVLLIPCVHSLMLYKQLERSGWL
jgi:uncharacterized membrane protein